MILELYDMLAILAIFISGFSLVISVYSVWRDRGRLRANARETNQGFRITAVNKGRRPLILTMLWSRYSDDYTGGSYIGEKGNGLRLAENEVYEEYIELWMTPHITDHPKTHEPLSASTMWIEDTLGRKHKIKHVQKYLKENRI